MPSPLKIHFLILFLFMFLGLASAEEINILYTGETHAMLYPCNCPVEPDGGVARRATLVKQLRKQNPNLLLLDSGGFFSGGLMDENSQDLLLDKERNNINVKALKIMKYDALAVGDEEFNFGKDYLKEIAKKTGLTFVSCNIKETDFVKPYIIKNISGVKIGVIGLTALSVNSKSEGVEITQAKPALEGAVAELRKQAADIVILLSHQGEAEDLELIKEISGIDIVIVGHSYDRSMKQPFVKAGSALVLRPSWEGRRLGKLSLIIKDKKIADYKVEELRLSDKINDDAEILKILPVCFSDANCKNKPNLVKCQNPGTLNARCAPAEQVKVPLLVITPKDCRFCDNKIIINLLKKKFPGLTVSYVYYPQEKADKLIKDLGIRVLPAYLLGKEAEKEKSFNSFKDRIDLKGEYYLLKPEFTGITYFPNREEIKGKIDLFISLYDKAALAVLEAVRDFKPTIHFLAVKKDNKFEAAKGTLEVEEDLRSVCVRKYYPQRFWNYIICRAKNTNSSWWEDCLDVQEADKIKSCARSDEGQKLLEENIKTNQEIEVMFGPIYMLDNNEVFGIEGAPKKEDLKKIFTK